MTAFDILLAIPIAAFGIWRIMCGLSRLEMIDREVRGMDFFLRGVPRLMRGRGDMTGVNGVGDLIGGSAFLLFALLLAIAHPSS